MSPKKGHLQWLVRSWYLNFCGICYYLGLNKSKKIQSSFEVSMKGLTIGVMLLLPIVLTRLLWYQPILIWKFQQSSNLTMFCFMFSFWWQIIPMKKPDNKPISTLIMNACTLQSDLFITYDVVPNFCHFLCSLWF